MTKRTNGRNNQPTATADSIPQAIDTILITWLQTNHPNLIAALDDLLEKGQTKQQINANLLTKLDANSPTYQAIQAYLEQQ